MRSFVKQYLLSIYQPEGEPPTEEILDRIGAQLHQMNEELKATGSWVFSRGLHEPSSATVVHVRDGQALTTDGPYLEGKEYIGGFWIISVEDLDVALRWGERAARIIGLPIEVRPFADRPEY
jgi:hypothetical protein